MGVVDAEAVSETDVTEEKQAASGTYHEEKQGQRSEAKQMQPDPADIFKGKITMGGCPLEEADVSRERENGGRDCKEYRTSSVCGSSGIGRNP